MGYSSKLLPVHNTTNKSTRNFLDQFLSALIAVIWNKGSSELYVMIQYAHTYRSKYVGQ